MRYGTLAALWAICLLPSSDCLLFSNEGKGVVTGNSESWSRIWTYKLMVESHTLTDWNNKSLGVYQATFPGWEVE